MKIEIEITDLIKFDPTQVKMTYNSREGWRTPRHLRLLIEREIDLP